MSTVSHRKVIFMTSAVTDLHLVHILLCRPEQEAKGNGNERDRHTDGRVIKKRKEQSGIKRKKRDIKKRRR
jgi:hypothetical protein